MATKGGLKKIADEDNEERFGYVFAVSGPGKYLIVKIQSYSYI